MIKKELKHETADAQCIILIFSVMTLTGCATQSETMKSQGYPVAYAEGFEDGCHSGKKAVGSYFDQFKKDVPRFNKDRIAHVALKGIDTRGLENLK